MFTGACHGNHCLTKTDVAQALYRATGIMMCPARETRNVLSSTTDTMFFRQDTVYKALTGLPELPKAVRVCLVTIIRFWNFREPVSFSWF